MKTFQIAAINIVMPKPHSTARYVQLLRKSFQLQSIIKLRGDYVGMLGALHQEKNMLTGYFYKFFDLDAAEGWFNISRRKEAEEDDLAKIQVPEHLKPHHQSIRFTFFPEKHRIIFISKEGRETLSPNMAKKLLDGVFSNKQIIKSFGVIKVTIEPSREQLQKILSIPRLKALTIDVSPPNPDDLEDAEREVMKRMEAENAEQMVVELKSKHSDGLQPDKDHKTLAKIAQSNGKVYARGENEEGAVVSLSTEDHPMIQPIKYNPKTQSRDDVLREKAEKLLQKLRS